MSSKVEAGKIYKLIDAVPCAFSKVSSVTECDIWNEDLEINELQTIAWGDWYQWRDGEDVVCTHGAGFEVHRLVEATADEIEEYYLKTKKTVGE